MSSSCIKGSLPILFPLKFALFNVALVNFALYPNSRSLTVNLLFSIH